MNQIKNKTLHKLKIIRKWIDSELYAYFYYDATGQDEFADECEPQIRKYFEKYFRIKRKMTNMLIKDPNEDWHIKNEPIYYYYFYKPDKEESSSEEEFLMYQKKIMI